MDKLDGADGGREQDTASAVEMPSSAESRRCFDLQPKRQSMPSWAGVGRTVSPLASEIRRMTRTLVLTNAAMHAVPVVSLAEAPIAVRD